MSRKRYSPAEIINKLREAEVLLSQDKTDGRRKMRSSCGSGSSIWPADFDAMAIAE